MGKETFSLRSPMPVSAERLFAWHKRPGAFGRLTPPWVGVELLERSGGIEEGASVTLRLSNGPASVRWKLEHTGYIEGRQFCDRQVEGPFVFWEHVHRMEPVQAEESTLDDSVTYEVPAGLAGELTGGIVVRVELERLFKYRHRLMQMDLENLNRHQGETPLKVAVTGSTGLIGSALVPYLATQGHSVVRMLRPSSLRTSTADDTISSIRWDPEKSQLNLDDLAGVDAVVHLAGDNIAHGQWTAAKKQRMIKSRVESTKFLSQALSSMSKPPKVFICASAIGYYGDRGEEVLTEESAPGKGFLADLCRQWEAATAAAEAKGIRVSQFRIGVVLSPRGGALHSMLLPFQMGAGGPIGSGKQYYSWISIDDACASILHALTNPSVRGPVNAVAPAAVTNLAFTKALGHVIARPTIVPMPAFAARMAFGEMADECLLASARIEPKRLLASGYTFRDPDIETAMRSVLGQL